MSMDIATTRPAPNSTHHSELERIVTSGYRWCLFGICLALLGIINIRSWRSDYIYILFSMAGLAICYLYIPGLRQLGRLKLPFRRFAFDAVVLTEVNLIHIHNFSRRNRQLRLLTSLLLRGLAFFILCIAAIAPARSSGAGMGLLIGPALYIVGSRLGAKSAEAILLQHPELTPVLYLRSFDVDEYDEFETRQQNAEKSKQPAWWRPKRLLKTREENALATIFGYFGPFIAIGRPGEPLPHLGAARMYVSDQDWQAEVKKLMQTARLVVIRVGSSAGLLWEMEHIVKLQLPQNIIFYFSQSLDASALSELYQNFVASTQAIFPKPLPKNIGKQRFLTFDKDWNPEQFGELDSIEPSRNFLVSLVLKNLLFANKLLFHLGGALRPFFNRQGVTTFAGSIFSDLSIAVGLYLAGPVTAGLMMMRNYWVTGRKKAAWYALFIAMLVAFGIILSTKLTGFSEFITRMDTDRYLQYAFTAPQFYDGVNFVLAWITYFGWKYISGKPIRAHILSGGKRYRIWQLILFFIPMIHIWDIAYLWDNWI